MISKIHQKSGMGFMEMIVTIAILISAMGIFTLLFIRSWEINSFVLETGQEMLGASQGVQGIVDMLRNARQADNGAFPLVSVDDQEIIFYGNVDEDSDVERIRLFLSGTDIVLETRDPTNDVPPVYPNGYASSTILVSRVASGSNPIFTYYDDTNAELTGTFSINDVKMVRVNILVDEDINTPPDGVIIESFASIRNLNEHDRSD